MNYKPLNVQGLVLCAWEPSLSRARDGHLTEPPWWLRKRQLRLGILQGCSWMFHMCYVHERISFVIAHGLTMLLLSDLRLRTWDTERLWVQVNTVMPAGNHDKPAASLPPSCSRSVCIRRRESTAIVWKKAVRCGEGGSNGRASLNIFMKSITRHYGLS